MWAKPGMKAAAATRLTTRFNDVLQGDLLFIFDLAVLHLIKGYAVERCEKLR